MSQFLNTVTEQVTLLQAVLQQKTLVFWRDSVAWAGGMPGELFQGLVPNFSMYRYAIQKKELLFLSKKDSNGNPFLQTYTHKPASGFPTGYTEMFKMEYIDGALQITALSGNVHFEVKSC